MIAASLARGDFAARLEQRAEALAIRRARQLAAQRRAAEWRSAEALWPDFARE